MVRFFRRKREAPTHEPEPEIQPVEGWFEETWPAAPGVKPTGNTSVEGWSSPPKMEPWDNRKILEHLLALSPTEFEHAITRLLPLLGYEAAKRTGGAGDLGADIVCYDEHRGRVVVQCKRFAPGNKVTSPNIQQFFGMMVHHGARQGIYVTTSTFTKSAFDLAAARDIRTIDGGGIAALFAQHPGALGLAEQWVQPGGRTSYERQCRFCDRRIQMRLMPNGKWLPFDDLEIPHDCRRSWS